MKFKTVAAVGALAIPAVLASPLNVTVGHAVEGLCDGPNSMGLTGTCKETAKCNGISYQEASCTNNSADVQCCIEKKCVDDNGTEGVCRSVLESDSLPGHFYEGNTPDSLCPGSDNIQCYIDAPESTLNEKREPKKKKPGCKKKPKKSLGEKIVEVAKKQKGTKYSFGGGKCSGPSPGKTGIGFDCSKYVAYVLAHATGGCEKGQNLFKKNLDTTSGFWCRSGIKKVSYKKRKPGDAVMYASGGGKCSCKSQATTHMAIVDKDIDMMWAAPHTGAVVRRQKIYSKGRCDQVLRFEEKS